MTAEQQPVAAETSPVYSKSSWADGSESQAQGV
jgi:hypothetical protein